MRRSSFTLALIAALCVFSGCVQDEDPFKEWYAAEKYENYAPPTAQAVAEGSGQLKYTPTSKGTLYLIDLDDMQTVKGQQTGKSQSKPRVVLSGTPAPGSEITFDPSTATISRPGKKGVKLTSITPGHRHQLLWQEGKK